MQKAGKFSHFCESQRTEKGGRKYKKHSEGICLANFVFWLHMAFIYSYVQFMNTVCYHRYGQHYLGPLRKPGHPAPLKPLPAASVWGGQSNISSLSALLCQRKQRNLNTQCFNCARLYMLFQCYLFTFSETFCMYTSVYIFYNFGELFFTTNTLDWKQSHLFACAHPKSKSMGFSPRVLCVRLSDKRRSQLLISAMVIHLMDFSNAVIFL